MLRIFLALCGLVLLASCLAEEPPSEDARMDGSMPEFESVEEPVPVESAPPSVPETPAEIAAEKARRAFEEAASSRGFELTPPPNDFTGSRITSEDPMAKALSELKTYPIAYETPTAAKMGEAFEVVLAIDATGGDSAADALPGRNTVVEAEAKLSNSVEATLSGAAFDIELMNKARQRLSPFKESTWRWAVTPRQAGQHTLYLEIHALIGEDESLLLDSFADDISVDVTQKWSGFLGMSAEDIRTYIGILGGSVSALLGLIALLSYIRSRRPDKLRTGDEAGDADDKGPDLND